MEGLMFRVGNAHLTFLLKCLNWVWISEEAFPGKSFLVRRKLLMGSDPGSRSPSFLNFPMGSSPFLGSEWGRGHRLRLSTSCHAYPIYIFQRGYQNVYNLHTLLFQCTYTKAKGLPGSQVLPLSSYVGVRCALAHQFAPACCWWCRGLRIDPPSPILGSGYLPLHL